LVIVIGLVYPALLMSVLVIMKTELEQTQS